MASEDSGPEKDPKPLKKRKKNPSIDTEPTLDKLESMLMEGTGIPQTQADYFVRMGLGNRDELNFYRKAIMDPLAANKVPQYRDYVAKVCFQLLKMIWADTQMYNRLRTLLQAGKGLSEAAMRSLTRKSEENGVNLETVLEVYMRGMEESNEPEIAFNRVNSFLAGGKAAELDADLNRPNVTLARLKSTILKKS